MVLLRFVRGVVEACLWCCWGLFVVLLRLVCGVVEACLWCF